MTYRDLMKESIDWCEASEVHPALARVLLLEMLRERSIDLYQVMDALAPEDFAAEYRDNSRRLAANEPLGYVLGYEWFYGYKIAVNETVLIPRGETEELVGQVLMAIDDHFDHPVIADIGCGSGAIAIALSKELEQPVFASDISEQALKLAEQNNRDNQAQVEFLHGDMLQPLIERGIKLDVLVCNPPYIKNTEHIQASVLAYEPHIALFGGEDGLFFYRSVLENARAVLNDHGLIAFEIGFDIGQAVIDLARHHFSDARISLKQDINGLDRMVLIETQPH